MSSIDTINFFRKTRTSICDMIDDEVDNITTSKIFDKMTTFDDDFVEITTTKRCCFENVLLLFNSKNIFNRFDNVIIYLTIFSYFCAKSTRLIVSSRQEIDFEIDFIKLCKTKLNTTSL